jgi:hypothetical protein
MNSVVTWAINSNSYTIIQERNLRTSHPTSVMPSLDRFARVSKVGTTPVPAIIKKYKTSK